MNAWNVFFQVCQGVSDAIMTFVKDIDSAIVAEEKAAQERALMLRQKKQQEQALLMLRLEKEQQRYSNMTIAEIDVLLAELQRPCAKSHC